MQYLKKIVYHGFEYSHLISDEPNEHVLYKNNNDYLIIYVVTGHGNYCVDDSVFAIQPEDLILISPNMEHFFIPLPDNVYERHMISFQKDIVDKFLLIPFTGQPEGAQPYRVRICNDFLSNIFGRLDEAANLPEDLRKLMSHFLLGELLTFVISKINYDPDLVRKERVHPLVEMSLNYISQHLPEDINLDILAKKLFVSKHHLSRIFKTNMGVTLMEYVTNKRVLLAKRHIESGMRPTETYQKCGFVDYSTFYRAYKRITGASPGSRKSKNSNFEE